MLKNRRKVWEKDMDKRRLETLLRGIENYHRLVRAAVKAGAHILEHNRASDGERHSTLQFPCGMRIRVFSGLEGEEPSWVEINYIRDAHGLFPWRRQEVKRAG